METTSGRFSTNMWTDDYYFLPPCTYNTFTYTSAKFGQQPKRKRYLFKDLSKKRTDRTFVFDIYFVSKMYVTEQFWSYTFLAYIAECGGFVGLFLGFSILQIEDVFQYISNKSKTCINFKRLLK